ncbi:ABC-2 type transport system permease protein [Tindallia magadiensis]|uniref:ABC-2 type transport system permease protein n=1 Tax=Tindallia magadiensis TaxID=69895 RepID=A0A1I3B9F8_9FIRM|nr:ABC transporter permease [Tindallia magadiensis]SFH58914.1 ABC-2 type transport system permease protein [Tindallia magadiensis]
MRLWTMFRYQLIQNIRDRTTYLEMILLPILLIFILGVSLDDAFQTPPVTDTKAVYLNEDQGAVGEGFEVFIKHLKKEKFIAVRAVSTFEEGINLVEEGKGHGFIHLPESILEKDAGRIGFYGSVRYPVKAAVVENVTKNFISGANTVLAMDALGMETSLAFQGSNLVEGSLNDWHVKPGAMDYYGVTMLVMFMMYGTNYAVFGMKEAYLSSTGHRIKTTPIGSTEHYLGLLLSNMTTIILQAVLIIGFTYYVYGINWGNNWLVLAGIILLTALMAVGIGTAVIMITRNETLSGNILMIMIPLMTFFSGGFFQTNIQQGSFIYKMQYMIPNHLAQNAIFNVIYDGDTERLLFVMIIMSLIILVTYIIALLSERRYW